MITFIWISVMQRSKSKGPLCFITHIKQERCIHLCSCAKYCHMSWIMTVINTPVWLNWNTKLRNSPDTVQVFLTAESITHSLKPHTHCTFHLSQSTLFSFVCFCLDPERRDLATDWWSGSLSQTDSRLFDLESTGNLDRPVLWWAVRQRTSGSNSNCVHVCCSKICISDETWP